MRSGRWWPATDGAGVHIDGWEQGGVRGGFRSMQFPAVGLVVTYAVRPWELRRFDACGRGMVEDYTAAGRMPSCIKYIVFICAFCAKSPLVRMRSPVQIWVAAPKILENCGFRGFFIAKSCFTGWPKISDPHRDPHAEMRQRNQWTQEHRTGSLPSCPAYFSFCF